MKKTEQFNKQGGKCFYCGVELKKRDFTKDHKYPKSKGGKDVWNNIVLACAPCNRHKGSTYPYTGSRLFS